MDGRAESRFLASLWGAPGPVPGEIFALYTGGFLYKPALKKIAVFAYNYHSYDSAPCSWLFDGPNQLPCQVLVGHELFC